jgi:hypothetical protein
MRSKPILAFLITSVLLVGCGKSKDIEVQHTSISVTDPNFPAPFCAEQHSNNLDAKKLNRSPEFYSNLCGFAVIRIMDASNWATGLIQAEYTTTPEDPYSYDQNAWFIFHNVADAKDMFNGDLVRVKLFIYPDPKDPTHISFVIWSLNT